MVRLEEMLKETAERSSSRVHSDHKSFGSKPNQDPTDASKTKRRSINKLEDVCVFISEMISPTLGPIYFLFGMCVAMDQGELLPRVRLFGSALL
ncbi:hypothetical protein NQZ68_019413 [Dissostichus eleginoides]|nr:hypothetical protein NQZ68_019400 [Dissostichus eleginoides]KAI9524150.1 hypothetical protein NQZ68_019413 [Dissostichus eleginoides]